MGKDLRVLLVEDVRADAELALRELKRAGLKVSSRCVDTEEDFRRELDQFRPHVILSDFSMPQFDGMDALAIARQTSPDTPFIFVSGTIGEEYAIRALKSGAYDYVLKGNLVRLPPAVERAIQDAEGRAAAIRAEQLRNLEHAVTRSLAEADSASAALKAAIRAVCETEGWECGRYFRVDEKAGMLRFSDSWNVPDAAVERFIAGSRDLVYRPGAGLSGQAWQSGRPLWSTDITKDPRSSSGSSKMGPSREIGIHGTFVFPVVSEGKTIGVLSFASRKAREPEERLLEAIHAIGSQIGQFLQRKGAEDEERRFRLAMDNSADMILLVDRATMRFVDVNSTACKLTGYSREELLEMGPHDVIPVNREELERAFDELIANPSIGSGMRSVYRCKDGTSQPCESSRRVLRSGDTHIIAVSVRDIRERIAADEALRKSNERFNIAVRATNDVIWDWDLVNGEFWWNENFTSAFGYDREGLERGTKSWFDRVHASDREGMITGLRRVIESGGESWSDEYRFRRADGSYAHVLDRGHVIRDGAGKALRMIGAKADISARKEAEERLSYLAQFDTLTGLPNKHLFRDRLTQTLVQARRRDWLVGVMYIDLDRFKQVNDTLGHGAGDRLLKETAVRLTHCMRSGDTVGRFGADEFSAVLSDLGQPGNASLVAQKIIDALAQPFNLDGQESFITASIGVTLFPADGEEAGALITNADAAMYRAKEQGRNNYQYFTPEMNRRALQRMRTEGALRRALERREFLLHYQPKVNLESGAICGLEALLRWQHPDQGLVSPVEFIPVLEDVGLIVPVGEWVLLEVCNQIGLWRKSGISVPPVAVNLSARQFQQKDLEATVRRILRETGTDPSLIQFELTESLLMKEPEAAARTLRGLKESGVKISVDDFGTGYSSLAYLKRFPIDSLKIDIAFIRDITTNPEDAAIALAIIGLAHTLKLKVIAEGVETEAQLDFLSANACDEMQGYYFARPLSVPDCAQFLAEDRRLKGFGALSRP